MACVAVVLLTGCGEETFETPPDCSGRRMVVHARVVSADTADVYLYDLEGFGFHLLPGLNSSQGEHDPSLSSDGRLIAFERVLNPQDADILIYDRCAASILPQPGLNTPFPERSPAFSNDGLRLAFVRDTLGLRAVRLYDAPSDLLVPLPGLAAPGASDHSPSPDQSGNRIAFVSDRNGSEDIFVYDATGGSLLDLPGLNSASSDVDPSLTPNGRYLAFASSRPDGSSGGYDIYLYDLETRQYLDIVQGVNSAGTERHPSISPSAEYVVYESNQGSASTDLWLYNRNTGGVEKTGASSPLHDLRPSVVWR